MTLTQLQEEIIKKCLYYRAGTEHRCNERLARVCFLFEDDALPDYCRNFEKIAGMSIAGLDYIWKSSKRKKGEKQLLKTAIIKYLLENGQTIQKDMIRENLISERKLKYHWRRLMEELGLEWKRGEGENYRYKIYRATYRKKRELKRILRDLNRNNANRGNKPFQYQTTQKRSFCAF